ncbi:hypothetical protein VNO78_08054 [Psophocarpus tetragonolobus]|uniref:Uncharacterized protein n=1 Tax=Psophocarpus tetragonolobus TaxID=3891 RepID=A0AAN9SX65_PSOTE
MSSPVSYLGLKKDPELDDHMESSDSENEEDDKQYSSKEKRKFRMLSDFNEVVFPSKSKGGQFIHQRAFKFQEMMANGNLIGLGFTTPILLAPKST